MEKVEWRCVWMDTGELSVTSAVIMEKELQELLALDWDFPN